MKTVYLPGDPKKGDPAQSVIGKYVRGRLKCFKHCSVAKIPPCVMSIFRHVFQHSDFPKLGMRSKGHTGNSQKSSKTGDRFTAISDLQTMMSVFYFKLEIGNSVVSSQSKFIDSP